MLASREHDRYDYSGHSMAISVKSLRWEQRPLLPGVMRFRHEHGTAAVEDLNNTNTPTIACQWTDEGQRIPVLERENLINRSTGRQKCNLARVEVTSMNLPPISDLLEHLRTRPMNMSLSHASLNNRCLPWT